VNPSGQHSYMHASLKGVKHVAKHNEMARVKQCIAKERRANCTLDDENLTQRIPVDCLARDLTALGLASAVYVGTQNLGIALKVCEECHVALFKILRGVELSIVPVMEERDLILLASLPKYSLRPLQLAQNMAARLVLELGSRVTSLPSFNSLIGCQLINALRRKF